MPAVEEGGSPSSGFVPGTSPPGSNRAEKRLQRRDDEEVNVDFERAEFSFRGRALSHPLGNKAASQIPTSRYPKHIPTGPSSTQYTQRRLSGAQSPARGSRVYGTIHSPVAHDIYTPSSHNNYFSERDREPPPFTEPYRDRSPLLRPVDYEAYLQRNLRPSESSGGDREDYDELGSPGSPRDLIHRGRSRSRSRSTTSTAPKSAVSANNNRRNKSSRFKSKQERATSADRRAAEAAEYLRAQSSPKMHPSRQLMISTAARTFDHQEPQPFQVPSRAPRSPSRPVATTNVSMASEVSDPPSGQSDTLDDQAFLFYDEISNIASLKTHKSIADDTLKKSVSEYDKGKDKIFSRFPSTSEASVKSKNISAGVVKELKAKLAERDTVLKEVGRKVPALLLTGSNSASADKLRIDELEKKCEAFRAQCEDFKEQLQQQPKKLMAELQKSFEQSANQQSTLQEQNNDKLTSLLNEISSLKSAHLTLNDSQEASLKKIIQLEQGIPPNLKQSLLKIGALSVRTDVNDNARRELRMAYEESLNTNKKAFDAQSSILSTIQGKLDEFTMEPAEISIRLKKLENLNLAPPRDNSQTAISTLSERVKEAERRISESMTSLAQFQALEKMAAAIDAKVEQRIAKIEQDVWDSAKLVSTNAQERNDPNGLDGRTFSTSESQSRLDSFKDEKDSFRKSIMHDVEELQTGTIDLMGGFIEKLQNETSHAEKRVKLLEAFSTTAKSDISKVNGRIDVLEHSSNFASSELSQVRERMLVLERGPGISATGIGALEEAIKSQQAKIQVLSLELNDAKRTIPEVITAQVIESIQAQPHILPYAFNTQLLIDCPRRLEEIFTRLDEISIRVDDVDFKADHLDQRMGNINTKDQAQYVISQIGELYPSLRNAIDTIVLKAEVEALSKRITAAEEAQSKTNYPDGGTLVYAPLRKDVDELSKKLDELKNTTQELKQTTRDEKKEIDQSHSEIAGEFASVQVQVDAVAADNMHLKKEMDTKLQAIKEAQMEAEGKIEAKVGSMGSKQEQSEAEINILKEKQRRAEKEIESIKGQKRSETQTSRNSIASPFDNKDPATRIAPKSSLFQTNMARQNSVQSDTNGKKRSKNGSTGSIIPVKGDPSINGGFNPRKKRKMVGGDAPTVEISDSD